MLKKIIPFLLSCLSLFSTIHSDKADFITYDWLVKLDGGFADHLPHWRCLFNTMPVRGFLECGCSVSTKYFLDRSEKVISIEYINPGYGDKSYRECLKMFDDNPKWIPLLFNENLRSNSFNNACAYQCSMHKDYALIDPTYLKELNEHFKCQIELSRNDGYDIDVAFVHPCVYIRGDMVKLLLSNKIPVVAAHNTSSDHGVKEKENLYGWNKVVTPPDYVKIYIPYGHGFTFWINKQYPKVITSILSYKDSLLQLQEDKIDITPDMLTELADAP
jgi:hypothetical protein